MKSTVVEASNYPIPEDVLVPMKLESVSHVEIAFVHKSGAKVGQPGMFVKWEWTFLVNDGEYEGLSVRGNSEPRFTSSDEQSGSLAMARPWAEALLGRPMELGEEIDTDDLIGLQGHGTVHHLEPRPKKDGGGFWFNCELDELFPAAMKYEVTPKSDPWAAASNATTYAEPPF